MTVATGVGGTTVGGAVLGVAATRGSEGGAVTSVRGAASEGLRSLPFTGADHTVTLFVLGLLLLIAGLLVTGMAHRYLPRGRHGS